MNYTDDNPTLSVGEDLQTELRELIWYSLPPESFWKYKLTSLNSLYCEHLSQQHIDEIQNTVVMLLRRTETNDVRMVEILVHILRYLRQKEYNFGKPLFATVRELVDYNRKIGREH